MMFLLNCCVQARLNILISGGTGSGKTTLLNVLSSFIPNHERIVTIEDALELRLQNENCVRLETQEADATHPALTIRDLVRAALRMRPDRILVGECRGAEALDMLSAMNTGHEGSMTTVHANTAREALRRLETMVAMSGIELSSKSLRQHISNSLHLVVQINRQPDGKRRITEMYEVGHLEGDVILTQEIFKWDAKKGYKASGLVPQFVPIIRARGVNFPADFFNDAYKIHQG
jgi:Flp pilus assembly CpaF family ATPase